MGDFPVTKRVFCLPYAENSSLLRGNKPRLTGASFLLLTSTSEHSSAPLEGFLES